MPLIRYKPTAPLDASIDCFWWSDRSERQLHCEHMLPNGSTQLVFALHDSPLLWAPDTAAEFVPWSGGIVHGPQWNFFVSGPKPPGVVAGVSIRAGAAAAILGMPVAEVADGHVPIDALWGARGRELRDRLREAGDAAAVFRTLERHFVAHIERPLLVHPAVAHALMPRTSSWPPLRVAQVQREAGYSARHFIALFRAAVGMTPNHYYRVQRFTRVLSRLAAGRGENLAAVAAETGYADQSHLTREFRAFAGVTPSQYRPRDAAGLFHLPMSGRPR